MIFFYILITCKERLDIDHFWECMINMPVNFQTQRVNNVNISTAFIYYMQKTIWWPTFSSYIVTFAAYLNSWLFLDILGYPRKHA